MSFYNIIGLILLCFFTFLLLQIYRTASANEEMAKVVNDYSLLRRLKVIDRLEIIDHLLERRVVIG